MQSGERVRPIFTVLVVWLLITAATAGPYAIVYFGMDAPDWAPALFTPLVFVYSPAWKLAYALGHSDFPLYEFGVFVLIENLLLTFAFLGIHGAIKRQLVTDPGVGSNSG